MTDTAENQEHRPRPLAAIAITLLVVAVAVLGAFVVRERSEIDELRGRLSKIDKGRRLQDWKMQHLYGLFLRQKGATGRGFPPSYRFDGGIRVTAGNLWLVVDVYEEFESDVLSDVLAFITPKVFTPWPFGAETETHRNWIQSVFDEELELLKQQADESPDRKAERSMDDKGFSTKVVIFGSGRSPRYMIRMSLDQSTKEKFGL